MKSKKQPQPSIQPRRRRHSLGEDASYYPDPRLDDRHGYQHSIEDSDLPGETRRPGKCKRIITRSFLGLILLIILSIGWFGWRLYRDASKLTGNTSPMQLVSALWPKQPTENDGRINILVAGFSTDDPGHNGAQLTDSIMILSIDPGTHTATTLSIPRDLYVSIPQHGYAKINAAYEYGQADGFDQAGYFSGGMGLLQEIIQNNFNIQLSNYALVNYTAFRDLVNAVGGISLTIKSDDPRGLYDPYTNLKLPNGTVSLDGQEALNLARARGDGPGSYGFPLADFDRTEHQREMLIAIKDKEGSSSLWRDPFKILRLADALGNNVKTNLQLNEMEGIYNDMRSIKDTNISSVGLNDYKGQDLLTSYEAADGESALAPAAGLNDYDQIQAALTQLGL